MCVCCNSLVLLFVRQLVSQLDSSLASSAGRREAGRPVGSSTDR